MTIQEFLIKHENIFKRTDESAVYFKDIPANILLELQNEVDLFENAKISIMEFPTEGDKQAKSMILSDNIKFVKKCKLYSIMFGPPNCDHSSYFVGKAMVTATNYDPLTFMPIKYAIIPLFPDLAQDITPMNNDDMLKEYRDGLHNLLTDMIAEPEKYETYKGYRNIMIRGIFEIIEDNTITGDRIKINN